MSSSTLCEYQARALYDYTAQSESELTLRVGMSVTVVEEFASGWSVVQSGELLGAVPHNYIERVAAADAVDSAPAVTALSAGVEAVALFDFQGTSSNELSFSAGARVLVTAQLDGGWWRGRLPDSPTPLLEAHFPQVYVRLESATVTATATATSTTVSSANSASVHSGVVSPRKSKRGHKARALFDFTGATESELTLKAGDVLTDVVCLDGEWWRGRSNGRLGHFPHLYVELVPARAAGVDAPAAEPLLPPPAKSNAAKSSKLRARAQFSYEGLTPTELSFAAGDVIDDVVCLDGEWWRGRFRGQLGHFPGTWVQLLPEPAAADAIPSSLPPAAPSKRNSKADAAADADVKLAVKAEVKGDAPPLKKKKKKSTIDESPAAKASAAADDAPRKKSGEDTAVKAATDEPSRKKKTKKGADGLKRSPRKTADTALNGSAYTAALPVRGEEDESSSMPAPETLPPTPTLTPTPAATTVVAESATVALAASPAATSAVASSSLPRATTSPRAAAATTSPRPAAATEQSTPPTTTKWLATSPRTKNSPTALAASAPATEAAVDTVESLRAKVAQLENVTASLREEVRILKQQRRGSGEAATPRGGSLRTYSDARTLDARSLAGTAAVARAAIAGDADEGKASLFSNERALDSKLQVRIVDVERRLSEARNSHHSPAHSGLALEYARLETQYYNLRRRVDEAEKALEAKATDLLPREERSRKNFFLSRENKSLRTTTTTATNPVK
jgi:hypothetical protein